MRFDFENISIDCSRREIRPGGEIVGVEPKVFDLIVYLVSNTACPCPLKPGHCWSSFGVRDYGEEALFGRGRSASFAWD